MASTVSSPVALISGGARGIGAAIATRLMQDGWRVGQPADLAALAAWLLRPESGFVTGSEFIVDGGWRAR